MKHRKTKAAALLLAAAMLLSGCGSDILKNSRSIKSEYADTNYDIAVNSGARSYGLPVTEQKPDFNTEEYSSVTENSFRSAVAEPLSTFSADVDTAFYSILRKMIRDGREIPQDAVRIEEMINYFRYDYPEPAPGEPFSVTAQIAPCPWNTQTKLMMVGMKAKDIDMSARKPMNLVFLIDVSGSMNSADKLPLVKKAFGMLTAELNENDRISVVTYAGSDKVLLEGAHGDQQLQIREAVEELSAGGGTAGAAGITTAYRIAQENFIEGGNNRIILATDGDLNIGISSEAELKKLVTEKRRSGVFLSVLGFGMGNIKDNKMETLADNGNGNYSYIDSEIEAKRVLVEEMGGTLVTVAKDVKFQVEFNPAYVKGYRLIGYENRLLNAEDFADDSKDAGEIGAGHTVTVLYEIADIGSSMEFASSDLKYGSGDAKGKENGEYLTVSVRWKEPDGDTSKLLSYPIGKDAEREALTGDMAFASAVAAFGMILRNSSFKGTATKDMVLGLLPQHSDDPYKAEFTELVKAAKPA